MCAASRKNHIVHRPPGLRGAPDGAGRYHWTRLGDFPSLLSKANILSNPSCWFIAGPVRWRLSCGRPVPTCGLETDGPGRAMQGEAVFRSRRRGPHGPAPGGTPRGVSVHARISSSPRGRKSIRMGPETTLE